MSDGSESVHPEFFRRDEESEEILRNMQVESCRPVRILRDSFFKDIEVRQSYSVHQENEIKS